MERVGKVAYRLQLPPSSRIHPVFHISQLKAAIGQSIPVTPLPTTFSSTGEFVVLPEAVLDTRYTEDGRLEVLVQWMGLPAHENTWVSGWELSRQFPEFQLEDKLRLVGRGIDTYQQVYFRKRRKGVNQLEQVLSETESKGVEDGELEKKEESNLLVE